MTWREKAEEAFRLLTLAETYADDGAFRTAAMRAEQAARLFREVDKERVHTGAQHHPGPF